MAFVLLIIGLFLLISSVKNTSYELAALLKGDFSGPNNFIWWIVALLIIGSIGYVQKLKPVSDAMLVLVIAVLFLNKGNPSKNVNGGFFQQFMAALKSTNSGGSNTAASTTSGIGNVLSTLQNF